MNLSLAPIQGMTVAYYRHIYTEIFGGIDHCYAPFVSTNHMRKQNSPLFADILPENNTLAQQLIPQILGNNAKDFRFFANRIADMGYKEINWNIGCPYPNITRKKKGSGLLPYPDVITSFLDDVCMDDHYTLTVKMRLGMNHVDEGLKVIERLNDYKLGTVIIHGRIGQQKYEGTVDLDAFDALYAACKHDVTYNGDIFTVDDFHRIQNRYPTINNFMLGRGALRDPFLPSAIKGTVFTPRQKTKQLETFHNAVFSHYTAVCPDIHLLINKMKEFWTYTSHQIDKDGIFLDRIRRCTSLEAYTNTCKQIFML